MNYHIVYTSKKVNKIIKSSVGSQFHGTVHSIYRKTINLDIGGQLIALQTKGSPVSPISVILPLDEDGIAALPVQQGELCTIADGELLLGSSMHTVHLQIGPTTQIYDPSLRPVKVHDEFANGVHNMIERAGTSGFARIVMKDPSLADDLMMNAAAGMIQRATPLLDTDPEEAADILTGVLGLGIGLTPSGDDYLCGLLAAHTALYSEDDPFRQALSAAVTRKLDRTNPISGAFLQCALRGEFSLPVIRLFAAADQEASADQLTEDHLQDFLDIGHSSGIDTLTGILYGIHRTF